VLAGEVRRPGGSKTASRSISNAMTHCFVRSCRWPAHAYGASEFVINGETVSACRFGTALARKEGLPIGVQLVSSWYAESTILNLGSMLEAGGSLRDAHPAI
jgi:hypothetical protein